MLLTQILKDQQDEGAGVWHSAGGTQLTVCQAEHGKNPKNKTWVSKEEEGVLKDALKQGKAAEKFVWALDQPDK